LFGSCTHSPDTHSIMPVSAHRLILGIQGPELSVISHSNWCPALPLPVPPWQCRDLASIRSLADSSTDRERLGAVRMCVGWWWRGPPSRPEQRGRACGGRPSPSCATRGTPPAPAPGPTHAPAPSPSPQPMLSTPRTPPCTLRRIHLCKPCPAQQEGMLAS
jgi:hypothetical protein